MSLSLKTHLLRILDNGHSFVASSISLLQISRLHAKHWTGVIVKGASSKISSLSPKICLELEMRIPLWEPCRCLSEKLWSYTELFSWLQHVFSFYLCRGDNGLFLQLPLTIERSSYRVCYESLQPQVQGKLHTLWIYIWVYIIYHVYFYPWKDGFQNQWTYLS